MHDYIPAIIVDEGKNAVLANQSSSSTNVKKYFVMMSSFLFYMVEYIFGPYHS